MIVFIIYFSFSNQLDLLYKVKGYVIKSDKSGFMIQTSFDNVYAFWDERVELYSYVEIDQGGNFDLGGISYDFKTYLLSQNVSYIIKPLRIISNNNSIKYQILNWINLQGETFSSYVKALVFGISISDKTFQQSLKNLNILHLFVISGFHISILTKCLNFIFKKLKYNQEISIFLLTIYCFWINFPIPITRALLMMFIAYFNQKILKNCINKVTIVLISMSLFLLFNVKNIYSSSFILTYYFVFFTSLFTSIKFKSNLIKYLVFILMMSLLSLFVNIKLNHSFSALLLVNNIVFGAIFSFIYPLIFFSWFITPISRVIINAIDFVIRYVNRFNYSINLQYDFTVLIIFCCIVLMLILIYFCYKSNKPKYWISLYLN